MRVIFNSDVLYSRALRAERLPTHVERFLQACEKKGHVVVIPTTTQLEFDRAQEGIRIQEINTLETARATLIKYGVPLPDFKSEDLVKRIELPDLLKKVGEGKLQFEFVGAELTDYDTALRKACLHEAPHPPSTASDEMRDLVIWEMAKRIAASHSGAILISQDVVHTHHRGDVEAAENQLLRAKNFDEALQLLRIETPASSLVKTLLAQAWESVVSSKLPISTGAQLRSVENVTFENTEAGTTIIESDVIFSSGQGIEISCHLVIDYIGSSPLRIHFSDVSGDKVDCDDIELRFSHEVSSDDVDRRLHALLEAIGGDDEH